MKARGFERGAVLPIEHVWRLAKAWYGDPRAPDWAPRTKEMSNAILESVELTGAFWQL